MERENRKLKAELLGLRGKHYGPDPALDSNPRTPLGVISPNKAARLRNTRHEHLKTESIRPDPDNAAIQNDFVKLGAKYATLKKNFEDLASRARKFRDERDGWLKYAESLEAKIKKSEQNIGNTRDTQPRHNDPSPAAFGGDIVAEETQPRIAPLHSSGNPHTNTSFRSEPEANVSFPAPQNALSEVPTSDPRVFSPPGDLASRGSSPCGGQHSSTTDSDGTYVMQDANVLPRLSQGAPASRVIIKDESSSDGTIIVAERSLRKRKRDRLASDEPVACRIKAEHNSSDPVVLGELTNFSPHESIDLDLPRDVMATPKKRRVSDGGCDPQAISAAVNNVEEAALVEDSTTHLRGISRRQCQPRTPAEPRETLTATTRSSTLVPSSHMSTATTVGASSLVRCHGSRLNHALAELAESGYASVSQDKQQDSSQLPDKAVGAASRLDTLLNKPSPRMDAVLLRPSRQVRKALRADPCPVNIPMRKLPFGEGNKNPSYRAPIPTEGNPGGPEPAPSVRIDERPVSKPRDSCPLRRRPLVDLRLDDFKINPGFNDGESYAFSEVVRSKSDRADLPGCTDPDCCGKHFRAMAIAELEATGSALLHRAADIELIEDYLGEQAYRLGGMNRLEKKELWLEAKTRELANKHGKHRHRFSRRRSPPGFWNADFPSTQEMQKEREEGKKREKRLIEERWREAMRGGGRWLFRDE